jgi:hypothetical protein
MALTKVKAGNIILTTPSASSNDVTPATTQYVTTAIGNLIDTAPSTLNTLNELAAALGDDVNFSTTVTNSIATKLPLAGGTLTGVLTGTEFNVGVNYAGKFNAKQSNADAYGIVLEASANDAWLRMGHTGTYAQIDATYNASAGHTPLQLLAGGSARIHIATNGTVAIGNTSPPTTNTFNADMIVGPSLYIANYSSGANQQSIFGNNTYYNSGYKAVTGDTAASMVNFSQGNVSFDTATTVTTDSAQSFTTKLYLKNDGNVGIGTTNPLNKFVVAHESHGVAIDYVGTLPYQAGLFTSSTAHTQTAYGDLNIKSRSDYTTYGIGFFTANVANTPTLRMKIDNTGNMDITTGNLFTDTTSGIFFSGGIGSFTNGIYGVGVNNVAIAAGGAERMRIEAAGQVVLTASTPSIKMIDSDDNSAQFIQGYSGGLGYYADDNNAISNSFHRFFIDGTEKMRIDESGRVKMPYQPGFFARGNTSQWLHGSTGGWNTIVNGIAHANGTTIGVNLTEGASAHLNGYDTGSDFNTSNGRFTAPVEGKYLIHGSIYCAKVSTSANDYMHFLVYVNGQQINQMYTMGGHKQAYQMDFSLNISSVLFLEQNDYVEWKIYTTSSNMQIYGDHLCIGAHMIS